MSSSGRHSSSESTSSTDTRTEHQISCGYNPLWTELSHPELEDRYLGPGVRPVEPSELPVLLSRYFVGTGQSKPKFIITQLPLTKYWIVTCEFKDSACLAESYLRKVARWVCAAKVFKYLGVTNEDLATILAGKHMERKGMFPEKLMEIKQLSLTEKESGDPLQYKTDLECPKSYAQVDNFCRVRNIQSPNHMLNVLKEVLIFRGYGEPKFAITQYTDCEDGRAGTSGTWTVKCQAGSILYKADGGSRMSTKHQCEAGMLMLLGVTRHDVSEVKRRKESDKLERQRQRAAEKARVAMMKAAGDSTAEYPFQRDRVTTDQFIEAVRLQTNSKGKQRLKRSIPGDFEDIRRNISDIPLPLPSELFPLKSESKDKVQPFQLAKAEPFQFAKAEPFQFAKAEPFPVIKAEPFPVIKAAPFPVPQIINPEQFVKAEPLPFMKAEPFETVKAEILSFIKAEPLEDFDTMSKQS